MKSTNNNISLFLIGLVLLLSTNIFSQTILLEEDFENLPLEFNSTGSATWARSSVLKSNGNYSDSVKIVNQNDSAILISNSFSTAGFSNLYLEFDQICKISFFNDATIWISADSGASWTKLTSQNYLGLGQFGTNGNKFSSVSYIDWQPANTSAIPNNSWWKHESFDISNLAGNNSNVLIKFKLHDSYHVGGGGNYGWLIDNIKILGSIDELLPPKITMFEPILKDTVYQNGPFDISLTTIDPSGIDTVFIVYNYNNIIDTIGMNFAGYDTLNQQIRTGTIPSLPYDAEFCYSCIVVDSSNNSNITKWPSVGCQEVKIVRPLEIINIGFGGNTGFTSPIFNDSISSSKKYSKTISIYKASELQNKGSKMVNISWKKTNQTAYNKNNGHLKIYLKHINTDSIIPDTSFYTTIKTGATLVYESNNVSISNTVGWIDFNFNVDSFQYNGNQNLAILTEWYRPDSMSQDFMNWQFSTENKLSISFAGTNYSNLNKYGLGQRPNIIIHSISTIYNQDIGVSELLSPTKIVIGLGQTDIKVRVKNYGSDTIHKFNLQYNLDGLNGPIYQWSGLLNPDLTTNTITISSDSLKTGIHTIKTWTGLPNDSLDKYLYNDSITKTFYVCNQKLNGQYTVGGQNSDFSNLYEVQEILNNCGINGPTTFKIKTGIYDEQIYLKNIDGISPTNSVLFTSFSGNKEDVKIRWNATGIDDDYVIKMDHSSHIYIKSLSLEANGQENSTVVLIQDSSSFNKIENCIIKNGPINQGNSYGIKFNNFKNGNNTIENNYLNGSTYAIYLNGSTSNYAQHNKLINNKFNGFSRAAIYGSYQENLEILKNDIKSETSSTYYFGIELLNCKGGIVISKNNIILKSLGSTNGISISNSGDNSVNTNLIANNFVNIYGSSTSNSISALSINSTSNITILNNSLALNAGSNTARVVYIYYNTNNIGLSIRNNIFSNFNSGLAYELVGSTTQNSYITSSDYNAYFSTGSIYAKYKLNNLISSSSGISGLINISHTDSNSLFSNPLFYSQNNLHSYSPFLNNSALPEVLITTDIDDQIRDLSNPDIGADEFTIATYDIGVVDILNPYLIDTQDRYTNPKVIIRNFGSTSISNFQIKYRINNGNFQTYNHTGTIASTGSDTITLPQIQIPVLDFSFEAFTLLTNDTLYFNDTLKISGYGLPLTEIEIVEMVTPEDGCDMGSNEPVKLKIKNNGLNTINTGLILFYKLIGNSTIIGDTITTAIASGSYYTHNFSTPANLSVTGSDSIFIFQFYSSHLQDPIEINDTLFAPVLSMDLLPSPQMSDTTINYGQAVTLNAISNYSIKWYGSDSSQTSIYSGNYFTTPQLFDTTTYWAQANTNIPSLTVEVGQDVTTNTAGSLPCPYGGNFEPRQQYLYLASELLALGIQPGTEITSLGFYIQSTSYNTTHYGYKIQLGTTTQNALTSNFINSNLTTVYYNNYTEVAGWNIHNFTTPFYWDGISNLVIDICNLTNYGNPLIRYSATGFNSVVYKDAYGACSSTTGTNLSVNRPNLRLTTNPKLGCIGLRAPVTINVVPPTIEASILSINQPITSCHLDSTEISCSVINLGTDTIPYGFSLTYAIDSVFITPEFSPNSIAPNDTLHYLFATKAQMPAGQIGKNYKITVAVNALGDNYGDNDTLITPNFWSEYSPSAPIISGNTNANYGTNIVLSATAIDSIYWYSDEYKTNQIGKGNTILVGPLFDTTSIYAISKQTIPYTNYQVGTGTTTNSTSSGPTPYGAGGLKHSAKNQFLITAQELKALGMKKGEITSLAFYVTNPSGLILNNFSVAIGTSSKTELTSFETNLTTVYTTSSLSDISGWNTYTFSSPYYWDGTQNIVVQTCFKNSVYGTFGRVRNTTTTYISSLNYLETASFDCSSNLTSNSYNVRPNIRFNAKGYGDCESKTSSHIINIQGIPNLDAGIEKIIVPNTSISSTQNENIRVILKNYGTDTLNSTNIQWKESNTSIYNFAWSGQLLSGETDTILIANHQFKGGSTKIYAWTNLPNGIQDTIKTNDSAHTFLQICMSGNYTIGQNMNYTDLQTAIDDLVLNTACGPIVLDIDSGIYYNKTIIPAIPGLSINNRLTIKSIGNDSTTVQFAPNTTSTENFVIKLINSPFITIKQITLTANGSTYANAFVAEGYTNNVIIENCVLNSSTSSTSAGLASCIRVNDYKVENIKITNNSLNNGYQSIFLIGTFTNRLKNFSIEKNQINGYSKHGIYADYHDSIIIKNNKISSNLSSIACYGIELRNNQNNYRIENNSITNSSYLTNYGIHLTGASGSANNRAAVANNMISINYGSTANKGVYMSNCNYTDLVYNSINIYNGNSNNSGVQLVTGGNNRMLNNSIFTQKGYIVEVLNPSVLTNCNNNNYFTDTISNTQFAIWINNVANLNDLKNNDLTANSNSISVNPNYYSITDLHTSEIGLDGKATPVSGFNSDYDGQTRNINTPDIGADEFTISPIDLGVVMLAHPHNSGCGYTSNDSIVVLIRNFGSSTINFNITNAQITLISSLTNPDTIVFMLNSGILASGNYLNVKIDTNFNLSIPGIYIFDCEIIIAGDGNNNNNAMNSQQFTAIQPITTFPFFEGFELGQSNYFGKNEGSEASANINLISPSSGIFSLNLKGGDNSTFSGLTDANSAFAVNSHVVQYYSCQIDATNLLALNLQFDLRQTFYSNSNGSWFRVRIENQTGIFYLKNVYGDSIFKPITQNSDLFITQIFNLSNYSGQIFNVYFEGALGQTTMSNGQGDNVFIDNIYLWSPTSTNISLLSINSFDIGYGQTGDYHIPHIVVKNNGFDTIFSIPLEVFINNQSAFIDTLLAIILPSQTDTLTLNSGFNLISGLQNICIVASIPADTTQIDDTICGTIKGLNLYNLTFLDDFEGSNNWFAKGLFNQWELGTPSSLNFNSAYSGLKAWATKLTGNYLVNSEEYLYSPYFNIPISQDTITLKFKQFMKSVVGLAYGKIQYSINNQTWTDLGYISSPGSQNWYNHNINGTHVWSIQHSNWVESSIKLDPSIFSASSKVQFRFVFKSLNATSTLDGWMIDDFNLYYPLPKNDVGVVQINLPLNILVNATNIVNVTIRNFGSDTLYQMNIAYQYQNQLPVIEQWSGVLYPDSTVNYNFTSQFIGNTNQNKICSYSMLLNDPNQSNDTLCNTFPIQHPDWDAEVLDVSQSIINMQVEVKIRVTNNGNNQITQIPARYTLNSSVSNTEIINTTLNQWDTTTYTFNQKMQMPIGTTQLCGKVDLQNDQVLTNNQSCVIISSMKNNDLTNISLLQNTPNPFSGSTLIEYHLTTPSQVVFKVHTLLGELVYEEFQINRSKVNSNVYNFNFLSPGVYIYSIEVDGIILTKKMMIK